MKTLITLTIVSLLAVTFARADIITKGGATALFKAPAVQAGMPAAAMKCANCKSEFVTVQVPAFKVASPTTATVERHACAACGNKWVTSGHGKAKVDVAVHTCDGCAK